MSEKYNYNRICMTFLLLISFAIISVSCTEKQNKDKSEKIHPKTKEENTSHIQVESKKVNPKNKPIICNEFSPKVTLSSNVLELYLKTDLPDETRITVTVKRIYRDKGDSADYSLDYFTDLNGPVKLWRTKRKIRIDNNKWLAKLKNKKDELAKLGIYSEVRDIEKNFVVSFSIPAYNQPENLFDKFNRNLEGNMVEDLGEGKVKRIEWEKSFYCPITNYKNKL